MSSFYINGLTGVQGSAFCTSFHRDNVMFACSNPSGEVTQWHLKNERLVTFKAATVYTNLMFQSEHMAYQTLPEAK